MLQDRWVAIVVTALGGVLAFSGLSDVASIDGRNVDATHAEGATGLGLGGVRTVWLLFGILVVGGAIAARVVAARRQQPPAEVAPSDGDPA